MSQDLSVKRTYLKMLERPPQIPMDRRGWDIRRAKNSTASFYLFLYNTVGEKYKWTDRAILSHDMLKTIIHDDRVEIYVLYVDGIPAGFAELDRRKGKYIELAYFGLMPEFIGQGWGKFFLNWVVHKAWNHNPRKLLVHTCEHDHPSALPLYLSIGFKKYKEEMINQPVLV